MNSQQEFVPHAIEEQDIRHIRLWFTDILGYLKSVAVASAELEGSLKEGIGSDGSAVESFSCVSEADTTVQPDPPTFQVIPRSCEEDIITSVRMFCDAVMPDGRPSWADPRQVLRHQIKALVDEGFHAFVHPEIEFFLVESLATDRKLPVLTDNGGYFDQAVYDHTPRFRQEAITVLEDMGIPVKFSHHENVPGQQETDLRHVDPPTMAGNATSFHHIIKQTAIKDDVQATFIPEPFQDLPGNGMHTHISLFKGDTNAFHDPDDENQLSDTAKGFIAGILAHVSEISTVTDQWANSYKHTVSGDEAPTFVIWGMANRLALVRVPMYSLGKAHSRRMEIRSLDSTCNPYLAYLAILAAGLKGIKEGYQLPEQAEDNISELIKWERRATGCHDLPTSLEVALQEMKRSGLAVDALGDHVYELFLLNKWRGRHRFQR